MTRRRRRPRLPAIRTRLLALLPLLPLCAGLAGRAFAGPANGPAATSAPAPVYEVSVTLSPYGLVFVQVVVGGRPALALVDTGSFRGVELSSRLATRVGLSLEASRTVAKRHEGKSLSLLEGRIAEIAIGGMTLRDVPVSVVEGDVERIADRVGTEFDVILGWGFLSRYSLLLDYRARTMRWSEGALDVEKPRGEGRDVAIRYDTVKGVPVVAGRIGPDSLRMLVDTGAPTCNLDAAIAGGPAGELVPRTLTLGGMRRELSFRVKDLGVVRESLGCAAVLGNNLFGSGRLYFDPRETAITILRP